MIRLYLAAGLVAALIAGAAYLRWDAVQDERRARQAAEDAARIGHIEDARERRNDIENLDCDGLLQRALERLSAWTGDDGTAVSGCGPDTPADPPGNGSSAGPQ